MDAAALIDQLAAHGPALATAAENAGWDAPVPAIGWDVRALVTHVGGVHRWAADIIRTGGTDYDTELGRAVGTGPADDDLLVWFGEGHAALVDALRAAPADLTAFTFLPADSPRDFWARRQAHETAVHRIDAENAAGATSSLAAAFAQDGIAELLHGFARRRSNAVERSATIALMSEDGPSWQIRLGGERIESDAVDRPEAGDLEIRGTSSDLYRWLWNRPSPATVRGDESVAELWANAVQVRWG